MAARASSPLLVISLTIAACRGAEPPAPADWFIDQAAPSGLSFVHANGMTGGFYLHEVIGPGVAVLDYDNDGDLDVYAVQGQGGGGKLFRNDLTGGILKFVDVTAGSGLEQRRQGVAGDSAAGDYGMGAAAGDIDNDGCVDLYLTNFGSNRLYRNTCRGSFVDVTRASGTADPGWSVSASFADIDRDGWLDLFVAHYVRYSVATNMPCYSLAGQLDYCQPFVYPPEPSHLFRNNRDGTFTDITARAGLSGEVGPALGSLAADVNGDGWTDLVVANDGTPNHLWINQREGTFRNMALLAGVAVSPEGLAKASMGLDAGDFDADGDEDLFITELTGQGADLYVNDGTGVFTDRTAELGLRAPTLPFTGFGTAWLDVDNDGWLDLATVNGAVTHTAEALARKARFALQQRKQLFVNRNGRFVDLTQEAGPSFQLEDVSRGAAFGDLDNDGDTDIVVANANGPLRLLINTKGNERRWVGLRIVTRGRDALGARVELRTSAEPGTRNPEPGTAQWRRVRSDGSYASANDPRVLVGRGDDGSPVHVRVHWPDGTVQEWPDVPTGRYTTLVSR